MQGHDVVGIDDLSLLVDPAPATLSDLADLNDLSDSDDSIEEEGECGLVDLCDLGDGDPEVLEDAIMATSSWRCRCSAKCMEHFHGDPKVTQHLQCWAATLATMDREVQDARLFEFMKSARTETGKWQFMGTIVCREAWVRLVGIGKHRFHRLLDALKRGDAVCPEDMRHHADHDVARPQADSVDKHLYWVWQNVGESLAEGEIIESAMKENTSQASAPRHQGSSLLEWVVHPNHPLTDAASGSAGQLPTRYIPNQRLTEMYEQYKLLNQRHPASFRTFLKVYHQSWSKSLRIRGVAQHAACTDCERFKTYLRSASNSAQRRQLKEEYSRHIADVKLDRLVQSRIVQASEASLARGAKQDEKSCLSVTIDGMDQAMFRIPRNQRMTKEWASLFRPCMHMLGCVVDGALEGYFYCHQDTQHNANQVLTVLNRALDTTEAILKDRAVEMPRHLNILSDNASKEVKNQAVLKFGCMCISLNKFDSATFNTFRVGHSHNAIDQRLGTAATALARADILQDPVQFRERVRNYVMPIRNRALYQEHLHHSFDWTTFLDNIDINVSGHTGKGSAHVFKLVRRKDLFIGSGVDEGEIQVEEPASPSQEKHPLDIMLLIKTMMASTHLAQPPLLCCSHRDMQPLLQMIQMASRPARALRLAMSPEMIKKYLQTALAVEKRPWELTRAAHYLRDWCSRNELADRVQVGKLMMCAVETVDQTPEATWIFGPTRNVPNSPYQVVNWSDFAPDLAKVVMVSAGHRAAAKAKAKAKAAQAAAKPVGKRAAKGKAKAAGGGVFVEPVEAAAGVEEVRQAIAVEALVAASRLTIHHRRLEQPA